MAHLVRYNGGTDTFYPCGDPKALEEGKEYEVLRTRDRGWQTDYTLSGVEGEFNSLWFDEVSADAKVYMAIGHTIPVVGEGYFCCKMKFINGQPQFIRVSTSPVTEVNYIGNNVYRVTTKNSTYYVYVNVG